VVPHFWDKPWNVAETETMEILNGETKCHWDNKGATDGNLFKDMIRFTWMYLLSWPLRSHLKDYTHKSGKFTKKKSIHQLLRDFFTPLNFSLSMEVILAFCHKHCSGFPSPTRLQGWSAEVVYTCWLACCAKGGPGCWLQLIRCAYLQSSVRVFRGSRAKARGWCQRMFDKGTGVRDV